MQKQQELTGFGRQDSSGPHTFNLLQASTTQLLVTMRAAAAAAGGAEAAGTANTLADLTMASSSGGSSPGVLAEANAVAAELELVITPPPACAAPDAMQASLCCYCIVLTCTFAHQGIVHQIRNAFHIRKQTVVIFAIKQTLIIDQTAYSMQVEQQGGNSPDLLADQSPDGMQLPSQLPQQWAAVTAGPGETPLRALQGMD